MEHLGPGPLAFLEAPVLPERQVAAVRLRGRDGGAGAEHDVDLADLLLKRHVVGMAALVPGPEPPALGCGLAAGARREPGQGVERGRTGEDDVVEGPRLDLDAPAVVGLDTEPGVAHLVALDEQPVAAGREHPRDGVIGRVGSPPQTPRRDRAGQELVLVGLVRAFSHVVLDDAPLDAHGVRALPEAEEPLARLGHEGLAADGGSDDLGRDRHGALVDEPDHDARLGRRRAGRSRPGRQRGPVDPVPAHFGHDPHQRAPLPGRAGVLVVRRQRSGRPAPAGREGEGLGLVQVGTEDAEHPGVGADRHLDERGGQHGAHGGDAGPIRPGRASPRSRPGSCVAPRA